MLEYLVPLISGVLVCLMAMYVLSLKRTMTQLQKRQAALIDSLAKEVQGTSHGAMGVGRKTLQLEQELAALKEQFEAFSKNDPSKVSYDEAARLVQLGAGVDDLMNTCGISRPEAELVSALTEKRSANDQVPTLTESR